MILLTSRTIVALLALAALPDRVPTDCTVSAEAKRVDPDPRNITALRCSNSDGFFVPLPLYLELRKAELERSFQLDEIQILEQQVRAYRASAEAFARSSSAADDLLRTKDRIIEIERGRADRAEDAMEGDFWDHPGVWMALGGGLVLGSAWAYGEISGRRVVD